MPVAELGRILASSSPRPHRRPALPSNVIYSQDVQKTLLVSVSFSMQGRIVARQCYFPRKSKRRNAIKPAAASQITSDRAESRGGHPLRGAGRWAIGGETGDHNFYTSSKIVILPLLQTLKKPGIHHALPSDKAAFPPRCHTARRKSRWQETAECPSQSGTLQPLWNHSMWGTPICSWCLLDVHHSMF